MDQQELKIKRHVEVRQPVALVTIMLVVCCFLALYVSLSSGKNWLPTHAFAAARFVEYMATQDYAKLLDMIFWGTFAQANAFQLVASCYFLWVFGSTAEIRIGTLKFGGIVLLCLVGGWVLLAYDVGTVSDVLYLTPSILTCGLIGAFLILAPPKPSGHLAPRAKYQYRIFRYDLSADPTESFGINPGFIIVAFIVYQIAMHFVMQTTNPGYDLIRPLPAVGTFLIGFAVCIFMVTAVTHTVEGNPVKNLCWHRYRELRGLDMTHEQSLKGAAKLMGIPEEQVREWIGSGMGGPPKGSTGHK
jgi:membrane associated rhomboid family serine protease